MAAAQTTRSLYSSLGLTHHVSKTSSGSEVHSYISDLGPDVPILTLIHGYPQSAYEWRRVVPALKDRVSLFVPELPGYGISTPIKDKDANTKRSVGGALLEALSSAFETNTNTNTSSTASSTAAAAAAPRKVILGGHDRGARICHRLAVDFLHPSEASSVSIYSKLNLTVIGTVLLDIIPTLEQWRAFADPAICQGYFHWPLLANADVAVDMISAYGGAKWCRAAHLRIGGPNPSSIARICADNALDVYAELFDAPDTLYYTALDYAAGAAPEANEQEDDQKADRKVAVPILVMFSTARLGARIDVQGIWRGWVAEGILTAQDYEGYGVGEGYGHYLPEEAYEIVCPKIEEFIKTVSKKKVD
ncbi:hypothetical protein PV05_08922 [Exophiala xenobiotica]|uniref:AB hydrolase-1 domain-containing protein n=1 Tax=Exophiala xenobiotica TaxID=348802 RepID=A0A0D2EFA0_9EURO|nr:uncharacterized protein PV05_08922 [Exophiala xenobiotica]KIW53340.1 hypothetical protein PV05_08922 [Exophiala xenobiotica]